MTDDYKAELQMLIDTDAELSFHELHKSGGNATVTLTAGQAVAWYQKRFSWDYDIKHCPVLALAEFIARNSAIW